MKMHSEDDIVIGVYSNIYYLVVNSNGQWYWADNADRDYGGLPFNIDKMERTGVFLEPEKWKVLGRDF